MRYNKQRKQCVNLLRKAKRNYYENLDPNDINIIKRSGLWWNPSFATK